MEKVMRFLRENRYFAVTLYIVFFASLLRLGLTFCYKIYAGIGLSVIFLLILLVASFAGFIVSLTLTIHKFKTDKLFATLLVFITFISFLFYPLGFIGKKDVQKDYKSYSKYCDEYKKINDFLKDEDFERADYIDGEFVLRDSKKTLKAPKSHLYKEIMMILKDDYGNISFVFGGNISGKIGVIYINNPFDYSFKTFVKLEENIYYFSNWNEGEQ